MKAIEFAKKGFLSTKYALGISIAVEGDKTIESEFRLAKAAILEWVEQRGRVATLVTITVIASEDQHSHIETFVRRVVEQEPDLGSVFKRVKCELSVFNIQGKKKRQVDLSKQVG